MLYKYRGEHAFYPFDIDVHIMYQLDGADNLIIEFSIGNTGNSEAPLCWGWHPYFTFHRQVDDIELCFPAENRILVDEHMLPTGKLKRDEHYLTWKSN